MAVSATQTGLGGVTPLAYSISSGSLPSALVISATTGAITGTPAAATALTSYSFVIAVSDSNGQATSTTCSGTVASALATPTCPSTTSYEVGSPFNFTLSAPGGLSPLAYSVGYPYTLPSGLSIAPTTGSITGTPVTAGAVSFKITVVDSAGVLKNSSVCAGTVAQTLAIPTCPVKSFEVGLAVSASQGTMNGVTPYAYSISSGSLPSTLVISATTGAITGTPAAATSLTSYSFRITVRDALGVTQTSATCSGTGGSGLREGLTLLGPCTGYRGPPKATMLLKGNRIVVS